MVSWISSIVRRSAFALLSDVDDECVQNVLKKTQYGGSFSVNMYQLALVVKTNILFSAQIIVRSILFVLF